MKVLLLGGGAREHAIGEALVKGGAELFVIAGNDNPGLRSLGNLEKHSEQDSDFVISWAKKHGIDLAVIGLEDPLKVGLPDALGDAGIPTVGPSADAARLETSKLFARDLMRRHQIDGLIEYRYFTAADELEAFLLAAGDKPYAVKPVGLTAGRGVRVMGVQLDSVDEAIEYGKAVIENRIGDEPGVILEEAHVGEEFTLQAFVDSNTIVPMPFVRDYKRAYEGDEGPNTGSMGSYSQADGRLSFVGPEESAKALNILHAVVQALRTDGIVYRGILYGQFMMTPDGLRVIEFNARFGDPEAMNVLPLLDTNFVDLCQAIVSDELSSVDVRFQSKATVCKYVTPPGYPDAPRVVPIDLDQDQIEAEGVKLYYAKVNERDGKLFSTPSRFAGFVGIAETIDSAEKAVERALTHVSGEYHVRHDIGTPALLNKLHVPDGQLVTG